MSDRYNKSESTLISLNPNTQVKIKTVWDAVEGNVKIVKIFNREILQKKKRYINTEGGKMISRSLWDDVIGELEILEQLNHPNVIKLLDYNESESRLKMYFEYHTCCLMQDLGSGMFKLNNPSFGKSEEVLRMSQQISKALQYIHSLSIAHRDVKPDNVLFSKTGNFILSDFGSAKHYKGMTRESPATLAFFPPEICSDNSEVNHDPFKADLWALGLTARCCIFHALPYGSIDFDDPSSVLRAIRCWDFRNSAKDTIISAELQEVLSSLLTRDPLVRIYIA
jgi:serine/threonine protein kinase